MKPQGVYAYIYIYIYKELGKICAKKEMRMGFPIFAMLFNALHIEGKGRLGWV